jgi:hypothetical protein
MKRLALLVFLLYSLAGKGQETGFLVGAGYNWAFYKHLEGINNVVDDLNKNRPWQNTTMQHFGAMQGFAASTSFFFNKSILSFDWIGNSEISQSSGIDKFGRTDTKISGLTTILWRWVMVGLP